MASRESVVNALVVGIGAMVVARFVVNVLVHHGRRSAKTVDREATRSWEGEGGSVAGVNMPQPALPASIAAAAMPAAAR